MRGWGFPSFLCYMEENESVGGAFYDKEQKKTGIYLI